MDEVKDYDDWAELAYEPEEGHMLGLIIVAVLGAVGLSAIWHWSLRQRERGELRRRLQIVRSGR